MKRIVSIFLLFFLAKTAYTQNDSLPFDSYRDKIVVHTSLSFRDAPFSLKGNFTGTNRLKYRANLNLIHGVGFAYKWFAINLNYKIPSYLKDRDLYGTTKYFDLGFQFTLKKVFVRVDFHDYHGYGIRDAGIYSDKIDVPPSNYYLNEDVRNSALGLNVYYLIDPKLNMKAAIGFTGRYVEPAHGLYLRFTANLHGISSGDRIIPEELVNSDKSIFGAKSISAFDTGVIPGYAYLNNINGWQFSAFAGVGGVIQGKFYRYESKNRGFLGLAPRVDLRIQGGYNVEKWFLMLNSNFDVKTIRYSDLSFNQSNYLIRLTYGYRFK